MVGMSPASTNSARLKSDYDRDGYVIVPGLYSPQAMADWKQALKTALDAENFNDPSGVKVWLDRALPQPVLDAMSEEKLTAILTALIGPDVEYLSAKAVFKNGKTSFGSPWHQDWFYWEGSGKLSVWIALDDATVDNGCLTVMPGSHTKVMPRKVVGDIGFVNRIDDANLKGMSVVSAQAKTGDAIFFHDLLVHGSHPNRSGADRWSLIATYRSGAVRDGAKVWPTATLVAGTSVNGAVPA